jgi:hypothetical protein
MKKYTDRKSIEAGVKKLMKKERFFLIGVGHNGGDDDIMMLDVGQWSGKAKDVVVLLYALHKLHKKMESRTFDDIESQVSDAKAG